MTADREELQRIAQLVEANRERMQAIEQQVRQLESIRIEQMQAIEALLAIPDEGAERIYDFTVPINNHAKSTFRIRWENQSNRSIIIQIIESSFPRSANEKIFFQKYW